MSDDAEIGIYRPRERPAVVGGGNCLVCKESTDTGLAVLGTGKWAVVVLMRLGLSYELATSTISDATGKTTTVAPGVVYATVAWDTHLELLYTLCGGCGQQNGGFRVGRIVGDAVAAPMYDEIDYVKTPDSQGGSGRGE